MREILFRGKRVDNGEWVEGWYNCWGNRHTIQDKKEIDMLEDQSIMLCGRYYEVDPETVGQYTGLKDKNGVKIFEGDILNSKNDGSDGCDVWDYKDHSDLVVEWNSEYCKFLEMPDIWEDSVHHISRIEVIGNIYESV